MMPIINPFYFYLIDVVDAINIVAIAFTFVMLVTAGICFLVGMDEEDERLIKKYAKRFMMIGIIFAMVAVFVPSRKTAEKMLMAKYVTYENYEKGKQEVKEIVDYIFEKVEKRGEE